MHNEKEKTTTPKQIITLQGTFFWAPDKGTKERQNERTKTKLTQNIQQSVYIV
jgi:hypothetical protein